MGSYTSRLGLYKPTVGETGWGTLVDANWDALDVLRLDQLGTPSADVSLNTHKITGLATPTAATDAATKSYADAIATGLDIKQSVRVGTTADITLSGTQTIDGVSVVAGNRVLVKNQTSGQNNGIYDVASGAWTRSSDADNSGVGSEVTAGMFCFIESGTQADTGWVLNTLNPITLGTTVLAFTQFTATAGVLPGRVLNVLDYGLFDDDSTDNTAALQALINTIPTTGFGRLATFIWPYRNSGKYQFNSQVNWGHRSIRNVGVGASPYNNPPYCSTVTAGADGITMFSVDGGGTLQSQSPSFEHLIFSAESHTGVTGLSVANANRCHLRTVGFVNHQIGVQLDEAAEDCAWHDWLGVHFYGCTTGVKSITSNSWNWWGGELTNCTTGIDCVDGDQIQIGGIKINPLAASGAKGIKWGGSESFIQAVIECNAAAGPVTCLQVSNFGVHADTGKENQFLLGLHGGDSSLNNIGIDFLSGAVENIYEVIFETSFSAGKLINDAGTRNMRVGGPMRGTAANRPAASQHYRDRFYWATDTGAYTYCDGAAWHAVATGI